ncbi:GNAT family N-acetyltransferase [Streptomyces sp. NPDC097619]|uniref:GNAT family N-acetyltransferase n=1 Tax=Streptomyces sp. NPDC097619 TaxID=3157228 RepID=UPI00331F2D2C
MSAALVPGGPAGSGIGSAEVRTIDASELRAWSEAINIGFLSPPTVTEGDVELRAKYIDLDRTQGAFDPDTGRCVATFRSFAQSVTVPGGAAVPATAVSNVAVLPTHRRRGLLSRMMAADLTAARARGEVLATLIAAEYPIYGRYGFGPAATCVEWEVDVHRTGLDPRRTGRPEGGGRVDLVTPAEVRALGPELHERFRPLVHGAIDRDDRWWNISTGVEAPSHRPWRERFFAVYRGPEGRVEGLLSYLADDRWDEAKTPRNTVTVIDLIALGPTAERALWHYLCSVDWVARIRTGYRAPDDLLPDLLPDPRAAAIRTRADWLWVRLLDVVRALEARTYEGAGALVLEVEDRHGFAAGRWRLEAGADGRARCAATDAPAELLLDASALGSLYLGDASAVRMAALGRVTETVPGAAARAERLFRTARRPWCPDQF